MKVALGPMAGINDEIFMELALSMGADVAFTEMISVNGLTNGNRKSLDMVPSNSEKIVVQLFGNDEELFLKGAEIVQEKNNSHRVDINMGCPVKKVVKRGYGAALMKSPLLVRKIVERLAKNGFVVSVKMRLGWEENKNYMEVAQAAVDGGAKLISIHGRTVEQGYSGKANWKCAKELKKKFKEVEIGISGDIFTAEDAFSAIQTSGADLLLVARGSIGKVWIFRSIKKRFLGEEELVDLKEKKRILNLHLERTIEEYGVRGIIIFRKFLAAYLKGLPNSHEVKTKVMGETNREKVEDIVNGFFDKLISCEQGGVSRGDVKS